MLVGVTGNMWMEYLGDDVLFRQQEQQQRNLMGFILNGYFGAPDNVKTSLKRMFRSVMQVCVCVFAHTRDILTRVSVPPLYQLHARNQP